MKIPFCCSVLCLCVVLAVPVYAQGPHVSAPVFFALNPQTNTVLWERDAHTKRPITSLTKLMTAMLLFGSDVEMTRVVTITYSDVRRVSTTRLRAGDKVSVEDLLHLMLIASDNGAARALARTSAGNLTTFVERMNTKAVELKLSDTHYADPSGLLSQNVSSAFDIANLLLLSSADERISTIMRLATYSTRIGKRIVRVLNTNHLVRDGSVPVLAGKTGYTRKSGFCLASVFSTSRGDRVVVVVLGAPTNKARFADVRSMYALINEE